MSVAPYRTAAFNLVFLAGSSSADREESMKKLVVLIIAITLLSGSLHARTERFYIVKRGETLSRIAQKCFGKPVYHPLHGSLSKLLALNFSLRDANRIRPGQKILLNAENRELASADDAAPVSAPVVSVAPIAAEAHLTSAPIAPAPAPVPSSAEITHSVSLFTGFRFTALNAQDRATNARAELYTIRDLDAVVDWRQEWTNSFSSHISFAARNFDFSAPTSSSKTLSNTSQNLFRLSFGLRQRLSRRFSLQGEASFGQELFLHGVDSGSLSIDAVPVPNAGLLAEYELIRRGSTSFGLAGSATSLFAASSDGYAINAGRAFGLGLFLSRELASGRAVRGALGFLERQQDTSAVQINETGIGGVLTLSLPVFDEEGIR